MVSYLFTGPDPNQLLKQAAKLWQPEAEISHAALRKHPDFHFLPENQNDLSIKISQIRQLITQLQYKPVQAPTKLAIISQAHLMTVPAQNALLKTLEEPPPQVQLILITAQPHSLLPTILSRIVIKNFSASDLNPSLPLTENQIQEFQQLLHLNPYQRLIQTPNIAPDRYQARQFIINLTHYFHQQLIKPLTNNSPPPTVLDPLKLLTKCNQYLDSNTHPQLTIDYLLLHLPSFS